MRAGVARRRAPAWDASRTCAAGGGGCRARLRAGGLRVAVRKSGTGRGGRRGEGGARGVAAAATVAVHMLAASLLLGGPAAQPPPPPEPAVISVVFLPDAAPVLPVEERIAPEVSPEAAEAPRQAEPAPPLERRPPPEPLPPQPEPEPPPPVPGDAPALPAASPAPPREAADAPGPPSQAAAPPSQSGPPAPTLAGRPDPAWEARVMARLAEFRHYPTASRARGEEGIAVVRARLDRSGRVLSAELERSSGSRRLDAAAVETFHRASPLPPVPAHLPDEVVLSIPVEFFVR